jgi:hypothetical protein
MLENWNQKCGNELQNHSQPHNFLRNHVEKSHKFVEHKKEQLNGVDTAITFCIDETQMRQIKDRFDVIWRKGFLCRNDFTIFTLIDGDAMKLLEFWISDPLPF